MAERSTRGLDVWLYGRRVARVVEPSTYRYRLEFTEEALDVLGEGSRALSLSLPVTTRPVVDERSGRRPVSAWLEGLLPEGNLLRAVATSAGVTVPDKLALLRQVGRECAGAVQFLAIGEQPTTGEVRPLDHEEVDRLVADLPTYHLPPGTAPQASLAGIQDKVLLTALPDGRWGWPSGGAASTHLVKPEPIGNAVVPHLVEAEHWAMSVARQAGLRAATTRLAAFDGRTAIVVERYDRRTDGSRLHQEDFCQALGLDPAAKYENTDEHRLRALTRLAADRAVDPTEFRLDLLRAVTFNVAIGNGDAHSKNYSLLLGEQGQVSLAPLYDCAPVMYLEPRFRHSGHVINGRTRLDRVDVDDLVAEAVAWGAPARAARAVVEETMERVAAAARALHLPPGTEIVQERMAAQWSSMGWSQPGT